MSATTPPRFKPPYTKQSSSGTNILPYAPSAESPFQEKRTQQQSTAQQLNSLTPPRPTSTKEEDKKDDIKKYIIPASPVKAISRHSSMRALTPAYDESCPNYVSTNASNNYLLPSHQMYTPQAIGNFTLGYDTGEGLNSGHNKNQTRNSTISGSVWSIASTMINGLDTVGEKLADVLGITSPKYKMYMPDAEKYQQALSGDAEKEKTDRNAHILQNEVNMVKIHHPEQPMGYPYVDVPRTPNKSVKTATVESITSGAAWQGLWKDKPKSNADKIIDF